jgi:hypothetical protein
MAIEHIGVFSLGLLTLGVLAPLAPAQAQVSTICTFTAGPRAGTAIDYRRPGRRCRWGRPASTAWAAPALSAATRAARAA